MICLLVLGRSTAPPRKAPPEDVPASPAAHPQNTRAASVHPAGQATPATRPVPAATNGLAQDLRSPLPFSQTIAHRQNPASITCLATGRRRSPRSALSHRPKQPYQKPRRVGDLAHPRVGTSAQPRTSHGIADHEWSCWPLHKNAMAELAHIGMCGNWIGPGSTIECLLSAGAGPAVSAGPPGRAGHHGRRPLSVARGCPVPAWPR
jgi:hypothetical protein